MTCHAGGTLEIFVEPQLPAPALWIAGTTPIARALVELGAAAGFSVSLLDPDAAPDGYPRAVRVLDRVDIDTLDPDVAPWIVVATQGQWDEEALERALRRRSAYVGLVTSPTRARVLRDYLRDQGIGEAAIAALRAPAGMDIGAQTPEEIALSIVAELIAVRRGRAGFVSGVVPEQLVPSEAAPPPADAASPPSDIVLLDPVCHMTVEIERSLKGAACTSPVPSRSTHPASRSGTS
jgi:xanthine dehydrogenase accessory factor